MSHKKKGGGMRAEISSLARLCVCMGRNTQSERCPGLGGSGMKRSLLSPCQHWYHWTWPGAA